MSSARSAATASIPPYAVGGMSKYGGAIIATCSGLSPAATVGILVRVRPGGFTGDASFRHWGLGRPPLRPGINPPRKEVIGSPAGLRSQFRQLAGLRAPRDGHPRLSPPLFRPPLPSAR